LTIARNAGDQRAEKAFLNYLGLVCEQTGDVVQAIEYHEGAVVIARELNDQRMVIGSLINMADLYLSVGRRDDAYQGLRFAVELAHDEGNREQEGKALGMLGLLHQMEGDGRAAVACYEGALRCFRETGDPAGEVETLYNLGLVLQTEGRITAVPLEVGPAPERGAPRRRGPTSMKTAVTTQFAIMKQASND
jgi:tetratricopeptide (TPR) repeat protein